ncbi:uncharacterized protein LOC143164821 isoform X1 [Aptenodytes patagonicus]|uniref:uncharacterized protein LOC143164821 isoform X1 n=1 Tax=Aptenodytes patagonicus TaxID=9234 RepID=UPI003F9FCE6B
MEPAGSVIEKEKGGLSKKYSLMSRKKQNYALFAEDHKKFHAGQATYAFLINTVSSTAPALLGRQQENWKDWDIRSAKGQRHFYSKVTHWHWWDLFVHYVLVRRCYGTDLSAKLD